ncbi:MAG: hypothetical protein N3A61_02535, partial [Ignavibacteria bacterium]|nr:hypothetical protein [Ignavibacteria bacterium]
MKIKILVLSIISLVIFITSCSKLKDDIASPGKTQIHPTGYADTTSAKFHGKELKAQPENVKLCLNCHGYNQTINLANKSCYSCHNSYPHKPNWINPNDASYHGKFLKGLGYTVGMCSNCHGDNFKGGTSNISCYGCHESYPHNPNWKNVDDQTNYHGGFIASKNWIMGECKNCHGTDLKGGTSEKSCFTCHNGAKGPEECNTCHGDFTKTINADSLFYYTAPPKGVFGE